jgi:hypothetical protein
MCLFRLTIEFWQMKYAEHIDLTSVRLSVRFCFGSDTFREGTQYDPMKRIITFFALSLYVALLIISVPPTTLADEAQDERAEVSGSVWVIPGLPEQLTIFEVKPDGSVTAGRWGFAGMEKEQIWIGTFRNGQLELRNQRLAESGPLVYPEYGRPTETITATIVDSRITGKYQYTARALNARDDRDFTGYCLNCFGYGPIVAVITIGALLLGGVIVFARRLRIKGERRCTHCRSIMPPGKKFCTLCGTRL